MRDSFQCMAARYRRSSKLPMRLLRQRSRERCVNTDEVITAADSDSETIAVMFSTSESSPETVAGKFVRVSTDDHQQSGDQQQAPDHDDETESDDGNDFDQPRYANWLWLYADQGSLLDFSLIMNHSADQPSPTHQSRVENSCAKKVSLCTIAAGKVQVQSMPVPYLVSMHSQHVPRHLHSCSSWRLACMCKYAQKQPLCRV